MSYSFLFVLLFPVYPLAFILHGHWSECRRRNRKIVDIDRLELVESHHGEFGLWAVTVFYNDGTQADGTIYGDTHWLDIATLEVE